MIAIIGDAHLDKRLYENIPKARGVIHAEAMKVFAEALRLAYKEKCYHVIFCGDLFNHYSVSDAIMKFTIAEFLRYPDTKFYIDGGNHDVTKVYERVCALDVLRELPNVTVVNDFESKRMTVDGRAVTFIPHMRSQADFEKVVMNLAPVDIVIAHASPGDMSFRKAPNDLYLTEEMLDRLEKVAGTTYIGHEHTPKMVRSNIIQCGSTMPFSFAEIGQHGMYVEGVKYNLNHITFWESDFEFDEISKIPDHIQSRDGIHKININNVPPSQMSVLQSFISAIDYGIVLFKVNANEVEDTEVVFTEVTFQLRNELMLFSEKANLSAAQVARLDAALAESQEEEDDS